MYKKRQLCHLGMAALLLFVVWESRARSQESPALPAGLPKESSKKASEAPSLPTGLEQPKPEKSSGTPSARPTLPTGLDQEKALEAKKPTPKKNQEKWRLPPNLNGFFEVRAGVRTQDDPVEDRASLAEARLQLAYERYVPDYLPRGQFRISTDFLFDAIADDREHIDLESGQGWIDLREMWLSLTPLDFMDVKAGRQILTWGTGNLIFLNDLFPKDYQSFFLGRDLSYLKAPSDAIKLSFYHNLANVDIVYSPKFDPDRYVNGSRLSFYDPAVGGLRGKNNPLQVILPDKWFRDNEIAARVYRNVDVYELAAYGYKGFWKEPAGVDTVTGQGTFPDLNVFGASIRGPAGNGIGNAEVAWYDSREDSDGSNPYVRNSQVRFLLGYEQEMATDLTLGIQYYLNYMLDYSNYKKTLPPGEFARDEARHWVTVDVTQKLMAQKQLMLSLFIFYSLSESDTYLRPKVTYDMTDNWQIQVGGNFFIGKRETFFGQFEENSNVYGAVRYSF